MADSDFPTLRPGVAPLTPVELAHLRGATQSVSAAAGAMGRAIGALGIALVDTLKVAGDVALRFAYGDLVSGPLGLHQLQHRLAAMRERVTVLNLVADLLPDQRQRGDLLLYSLKELYRIGKGETAVMGTPHFWPAGLNLEDLHRRLWAIQTELVAVLLSASNTDVGAREKALRAALQQITRIAAEAPTDPGPDQ